jgi:hypothetical protein
LVWQRVFSKRPDYIQRHSLETLLEVSRHAIFGPSLKSLEISVACVEDIPDRACSEDRYQSPEEEYDDEFMAEVDEASKEGGKSDVGGSDGESKQSTAEEEVNMEAHERYVEDQTYIRESGMDTACLTRALAILHNCKTIIISSERRTWGSKLQARETGLWPATNLYFLDSKHLKRVFHVIFTAIALSHIKLEEFNIFCPLGTGYPAVKPAYLIVPEPFLQQLRTGISVVTTLRLKICLDNIYGDELALVDLLRLIGFFQGLRRLGLYGSFPRPPLARFAQSLHVPGLRALEIRSVNCTVRELRQLLLRHRDTLEEISFYNVHFTELEKGSGWIDSFKFVCRQLNIRRLTVEKCLLLKCWLFFVQHDGKKVQKIDLQGNVWEGLRSTVQRLALER